MEDCLHDVVRVLRFFAELRNYSYIDRIANSLTPDPAEKALQEAMRHLRSLYDSSFPYKDKNTGKEYRAIEDEGKTVVLPKIPSEDCVERVLEAMSDHSVRRRLAILSLSYGR